jgi:hypothetical protein
MFRLHAMVQYAEKMVKLAKNAVFQQSLHKKKNNNNAGKPFMPKPFFTDADDDFNTEVNSLDDCIEGMEQD